MSPDRAGMLVCEVARRDLELAGAATRAALELGLTASDAAYVVLASARNAVLVTADRALAAAYEPSVLVP
ncbi:MAG TPA: hypothetical protein VH063_07465 [Gaiellaceae bacterium]|nr:hypothetical protein [Gaiellaceae bacterium]